VIVQHPRDTSALYSLLALVISIFRALLALSLVGIHAPFRILLLRHQASTTFPWIRLFIDHSTSA
jgi:hypothetical protein